MSARSGILAGGNWIVDRLKVIDTYPRQDTLANILSDSIGNGGSPFNVLVDLARLRTRLSLSAVGLIGDDADGEWIERQCTSYDIDTRQLRRRPGVRTSYTDVMTVRDTGRRTFFHQRGANALLDDSDFEFHDTRSKMFHLGYLLLLDRLDRPDAQYGTVAARVLSRAQQAGLKTSIDVVSEESERFAQIVMPSLPHVDYCFLNELEAERTTGLTVRTERGIDLGALQAASRKLLEAGVRSCVIVHFAEGACALSRDGQFHLRGSLRVPPAEIVSTVGAGDAFAAGALYALHEDEPIERALRCGICVAAASLTGAGASDGIGSMQDCMRLEETLAVREL